MHAIKKFRMRRLDRYECDVLHPPPLNGIFVSIDQLYKPLAENHKRRMYSRWLWGHQTLLDGAIYTGTQLLILIIDVTWNVNACY